MRRHLFTGIVLVLAAGTVMVADSSAEAATAPRRIAYVASNGSELRMLDLATNTMVGSISGFLSPSSLAVTSDGARAYVTNSGGTTVSVLDTATNTIAATIPGFSVPQTVVIAPDGKHAYVTNNSVHTVSVLDTATSAVTATIPVGRNPMGLAVAPDGTHVYAVNYGGSTVSVIDTGTNTVTATIPVGLHPMQVAVGPDGSHAYVTNNSGGTVSVIDTASNAVTATIPVGTQPVGVAVTPDGSRAYVANYSTNNVSVINTATNTVATSVPVGLYPQGLAITADGSQVHVANKGGTVSVIATGTNTVTATATVGGGPSALAYATSFPTGPTANLAISLFNDGIGADGSGSTRGWFPITSYAFEFGDGSHVTQSWPIANHQYAHGGTYTVQLTVTDTLGLTSSTTRTVTVQPLLATIALLSQSNDRYVTAEGAGTQPLVTNRLRVGSWEGFDLLDIDGTNVAFRARVNGQYVRVGSGWTLSAAAPGGIDLAALFQIVHNPDGTISLLSQASHKYVSTNNGEWMTADRLVIGPWEKFNPVHLLYANSTCMRGPTTAMSPPRTPAPCR